MRPKQNEMVFKSHFVGPAGAAIGFAVGSTSHISTQMQGDIVLTDKLEKLRLKHPVDGFI
jgi:hypothetical protein